MANKTAKKTRRSNQTAAKPKAIGWAAVKAESVEKRKERAEKILAALRKEYPDATCALNHSSALELLVATILSAQCTDDRVNIVTADLFKRYKTAADYAGENPAVFQEQIKSTGFFRQKTKSILSACAMMASEFGGKVPETMEELTRLPGVARKTANVVLGTWFGKNEGIAVDTHVGRVATRLGLTRTSRNEKDAAKIEADLLSLVPRPSWTFFGHAMIWHGRRVCMARKPACDRCVLNKLCPSAFSF
jgi:endonuclease-3